jgi:hypothetical protein
MAQFCGYISTLEVGEQKERIHYNLNQNSTFKYTQIQQHSLVSVTKKWHKAMVIHVLLK